MGVPVITPGTGSRDRSVTDLIQSIALQETALSHILNAEGKKMQAVIAMPDETPESLMELNNSVNKLVNSISRLEMVLHAKLELFPEDTLTEITPPDPAKSAPEALARINVPTVSIDVALDSPTAQQEAINKAVSDAQAQVGSGYTVKFNPAGYTNDGTLTGFFEVTSDTNSADTAANDTEKTITVTSTVSVPVTPTDPPVSANTATSNSAARFLGGTLLSGDLSSIAGIGGATEKYENGVTSGTEQTALAGLDLVALGQTLINIDGISLPLGNLLQLGAVNQYAQASQDGVSRAFSGAVSNDGIVSIGGSADFPADMKLDLMKLLPQTPILTKADLSIGAITGAAHWNAALGNTLASTTDVENPSQGRDYDIAGGNIDLNSPYIGELVDSVNTTLGYLGNAVNNIGDKIVEGTLDGLTNSLNLLSSIVPLVSVGDNNITATVNMDIASLAAPILSQTIASSDGALKVDLSSGSIQIDLAMLAGGSLNNLAPNTPLLSTEVIDKLTADLDEILSSLQTQLNKVQEQALDAAAVNISGHITMLKTLGLESAGLDLSYDGTLGDLLDGSQKISVNGSGLLGALSPVIDGVTGALQTAIAATVNTELSGFLSTVGTTIGNVITSLSGALSPAFTLIDDVLSININIQQDDADGVNTFTEIPLQLSLLKDSVTLNLGKVVVGENTYSAV